MCVCMYLRHVACAVLHTVHAHGKVLSTIIVAYKASLRVSARLKATKGDCVQEDGKGMQRTGSV